MKRAAAGFRPYFMVVAVLWVLGTAGALVYARQKSIASAVIAAVLPALLLEAAMYAGTGFESVRAWLRRLAWRGRILLVVSAAVPYLVMSLAFGNFRAGNLALLLALAAAAVFWRRLFPEHIACDLLFLFFAAWVFAGKTLSGIYVNPAGAPALDILGRMMWIRLLAMVLLLRGAEGAEFGFLPTARDWRTGALYYLFALPPVLALSWWLGIVRGMVDVTPRIVLLAAGTFLGFLWVAGLAEEFFFRGILQPLVQKLVGSAWLGLAITSVTFGLAHLGFRGFPNWRFAFVAGVCGVFYGLAYARAKSVLASTVTHALLVMTWRVFFV
jgi:membrane protease YdiL (CAAX protease family)